MSGYSNVRVEAFTDINYIDIVPVIEYKSETNEVLYSKRKSSRGNICYL